MYASHKLSVLHTSLYMAAGMRTLTFLCNIPDMCNILDMTAFKTPQDVMIPTGNTALYVQVSALPVVYKLLTAQDKGAQKAAIQMLTFLCQMRSEWQSTEQLTLATFGNGVILSDLVQRIESMSKQTKLSSAKSAELASLLQLLSSATSGTPCMSCLG